MSTTSFGSVLFTAEPLGSLGLYQLPFRPFFGLHRVAVPMTRPLEIRLLRLALETGRDLARRLAKNGKEEPARKALQQAPVMRSRTTERQGITRLRRSQAAAVAMVLDGHTAVFLRLLNGSGQFYAL